jgi:hypothetical protein
MRSGEAFPQRLPNLNLDTPIQVFPIEKGVNERYGAVLSRRSCASNSLPASELSTVSAVLMIEYVPRERVLSQRVIVFSKTVCDTKSMEM